MDYINIRKKYRRLMCIIFMHSFMYFSFFFNWKSCGGMKSNNKSNELNNIIIDISGDSHTTVKQENNKKSTTENNINNKNIDDKKHNDKNDKKKNDNNDQKKNDKNVMIGNNVPKKLDNNSNNEDNIVRKLKTFEKKNDKDENCKDLDSVKTISTNESEAESEKNNNKNTEKKVDFTNHQNTKSEMENEKNNNQNTKKKANLKTPEKLKNNEPNKVDSINPKDTKKANLTIPKIRVEVISKKLQYHKNKDPKNNEKNNLKQKTTPEGTKSTTQEEPKTHGSLFQIFSICGGCAEGDSQEQEQ